MPDFKDLFYQKYFITNILPQNTCCYFLSDGLNLNFVQSKIGEFTSEAITLEAITSKQDAERVLHILEVFLFGVRLIRLTAIKVYKAKILNKDSLHIFLSY